MGHPTEMPNITAWAHNQSPRPDFHRLDLQPYRMQPLFKRGTFEEDKGKCLYVNVIVKAGTQLL